MGAWSRARFLELHSRMSMRRPHVGQRIFTSAVEGDDVVYDERAGVEVVECVVDGPAADVAGGLGSLERGSSPLLHGR